MSMVTFHRLVPGTTTKHGATRISSSVLGEAGGGGVLAVCFGEESKMMMMNNLSDRHDDDNFFWQFGYDVDASSLPLMQLPLLLLLACYCWWCFRIETVCFVVVVFTFALLSLQLKLFFCCYLCNVCDKEPQRPSVVVGRSWTFYLFRRRTCDMIFLTRYYESN